MAATMKFSPEVEDEIKRLLAIAPPLSQAQINRLSATIRPPESRREAA